MLCRGLGRWLGVQRGRWPVPTGDILGVAARALSEQSYSFVKDINWLLDTDCALRSDAYDVAPDFRIVPAESCAGVPPNLELHGMRDFVPDPG